MSAQHVPLRNLNAAKGHPDYERSTLRIPSVIAFWNLDAWRYLPKGKKGPYPVIVMAHGLSGTKSMKLATYAEAFAALGYACVVFDYRRWGASDGKPRHSVYVTEQLEDYRTVIKFCRQQAEFDPHRVILWGSSLSGGHVVSLASEKHLNICAGVAQCPYLGVIAKSPLTLSAIKTLGWAVLDILKQAIGLSPIFIPAVAENGTVGVLTSPGTFEGAYALVENDGDYPNEISASSIFELPFYKPNVSAKDIACPLLVVALEHDNICSIDGAREVAAASDKVKLKVLDGGHFEAYPGQALFEESLKTQVAFLLEACPP